MTIRPLIAALTLTLAAGGLSACGKTGELERPAPLFGAQAKADYEQQKADAAAAKARDAQTRRNVQGNTVFDPVDRPPTQAPYAPRAGSNNSPDR